MTTEKSLLFARCSGPVDGFTVGKVYLADSCMSEGDAVLLDFIEIKNDAGILVRIRAKGKDFGPNAKFESFEIVPSVYGVFISRIRSPLGKIVVIVEASEKSFGTDDKSWYDRSGLTILDHTNIFPGMKVLDTEDKKWKPVVAVNENLWIKTSLEEPFRELRLFQLAIDDDGDIMARPMVKCCNPATGLTVGRHYYMEEVNGGWIFVRNDSGELEGYYRETFS